MSKAQLALALSKLPEVKDDRVLVGTNTADDAGIIKIRPDLALVQTVDVFAPVVDDPYTFGRIAAVNSISDIYAMGGKPISALNVVGFPMDLATEVLGEMLHGAQDAANEAGVAILGGHTFQDSELRFGLSVTGEIHPERIYTNSNAQPGDRLLLTKPLGTGTVIQAMMTRGVVSESLYRETVESMVTSNLKASEAMAGLVNACTDITGFGFLGHCWELADGSNLEAEIIAGNIPILPNVLDLIREDVTDAGMKMNLNSFEKYARFDETVPSEYKTLVYSSETSGGLLLAVPENNLDRISSELDSRGVFWADVGRMTKENRGFVSVI